MSTFHSSDGRSVPMGILVEAAKKNAKPERPTPKRKPDGGDRSVPWMWIAVAGSVGWVVVVLVVAVVTISQEQSHEAIANRPIPRAIDGIGEVGPVVPIAAPKPVNQEPIAVIAAPNGAPVLKPKLVRVAPEPIDELPPPLEIVKPLIEQPELPVAAPEQPPKAAKKQLDFNVFANCEKIGTDIQFMKDPVAAFKRAKEEKKMVFMIHLSGHLEDDAFT